MVTSATRQYFYFRSKIWRHHRLLGLDGQEVRPNRSKRGRVMAILNFSVATLNRVELHHHAKCRRNRLNRGWNITISRFFQDGGRPPSWICNACVGNTHEGHLVDFITVQNLVGIDAVVLIICTFFDFASLAWKRLFTPQNWGVYRGK